MSWAVWITGLPGSGKSAVARALAARLGEHGERVTVLELDVVRRTLTPTPTYRQGERDVVYRALVFLARTLTEHGASVIIDATAHRRAWRDLARASITHFAEVQLVCPVEVCREREQARTTGNAPKGIYAAADRPGATVPGVNVPYEAALAPELTIDTSIESADEAAARIAPLALGLTRLSPGRRAVGARAPWALWITGLPGSGKTTLASAVAEALARAGVEAALLDLAEVCDFLVPGGFVGPAEAEIVNRTLVLAAKLLTDAGLPVIIDATAQRRAWRQLARTLIVHFAEVELVCPPEICRERERAARWNPTFCAHGGRRKTSTTDVPDSVLDYERSLNPELTVHTHVRDLWSATDEILGLARRLHRAALRRLDLT